MNTFGSVLDVLQTNTLQSVTVTKIQFFGQIQPHHHKGDYSVRNDPQP